MKGGSTDSLVADEPVEFENNRLRVQANRLRNYRLKVTVRIMLIKKNREISTCNRLDLETLGSDRFQMPH